MADVYWRGADGNIYIKNSSGVQNMGTSGVPLSPTYLQSLTQIADPATGQMGTPLFSTSAPSTPAPTGGTYVAPKVLNTGAISNTQATIDQLPALLQAALEAENQRFRNTMGGFDAAEQQQRGTYDQSTTTNQLNYDSNFMDSIRAGIKGLGGLFNILRGTGAAGSSVEGDVRDVVGEVTSKDIRTGADTRNENQGALDASLSTFLTDLGLKRRQNEDVRVNNERAIRRDSATQLQDLYGKMAGFYGEADRTAEANEWLARAGGLTPEIATNSRTQVSNYDSTPVAVKAPELTAFAAPSQPNAISAPTDGQVGSGIFTMSDRRRNRQALPVGV